MATRSCAAAAVESAAKAAYTGTGDLVGNLLPGVRARVGDDGQLLLAGANAADRYLGEQPPPRTPLSTW